MTKDLDLTDRLASNGEAFAPDNAASIEGRDTDRIALIDAIADLFGREGIVTSATSSDGLALSASIPAGNDAVIAPVPLIHHAADPHDPPAVTITQPTGGGTDPGNGGGDPGGTVTPPPVVTPPVVTPPSPPTAPSWSVGSEVGQDAKAGTIVGTVAGTDPQGGQITYGLSGDQHGLAINAQTGQITVADPSQVNTSSTLTVTETDVAGLTTTGQVNVTVNPLHLTSLTLSDSVFWSQPGTNGATAGQVIGNLAVTDDDPQAASHAVTYTLSGSAAADFKVVGGQLEVAAGLAPGQYHFNITATSAVSGSTITTAADILVTAPDSVSASNATVSTGYNAPITLSESDILSMVHAQSAYGELLHVAAISDAGGNATVTETAGAYGNSWTITPAAGYSGAEQISVTVGDREATATTTIELDVAGLPPPPVVTPPPPTEHLTGGSFSLGSFDQGAGPITITAAQIEAAATSSTGEAISITGNPTVDHGTLTPIAGGWTYTPDGTYAGPVTLTATVQDTDGNTATVTATGTETVPSGTPLGLSLSSGGIVDMLDTSARTIPAITLTGTAAGNVTATITLSDATAGALSTVGGSLSGAGLVAQGGGVYTITGTQAQVQADLISMVFTPAMNNGEAAGGVDTISMAVSVTDGTTTANTTETINTTPGDVSAASFSLPFGTLGGWINDAVSGTINLAPGFYTLDLEGVANPHGAGLILAGVDNLVGQAGRNTTLDLEGGAGSVIGGTSGHVLFNGGGSFGTLWDDVIASGTTSPIWITGVNTVTTQNSSIGAHAVTVDASNATAINFNFGAGSTGVVTIASGLNSLTVNGLTNVAEVFGDPDTAENLAGLTPHAALTITTAGNFAVTEFADWTAINLATGANTLGQLADVNAVTSTGAENLTLIGGAYGAGGALTQIDIAPAGGGVLNLSPSGAGQTFDIELLTHGPTPTSSYAETINVSTVDNGDHYVLDIASSATNPTDVAGVTINMPVHAAGPGSNIAAGSVDTVELDPSIVNASLTLGDVPLLVATGGPAANTSHNINLIHDVTNFMNVDFSQAVGGGTADKIQLALGNNDFGEVRGIETFQMVGGGVTNLLITDLQAADGGVGTIFNGKVGDSVTLTYDPNSVTAPTFIAMPTVSLNWSTDVNGLAYSAGGTNSTTLRLDAGSNTLASINNPHLATDTSVLNMAAAGDSLSVSGNIAGGTTINASAGATITLDGANKGTILNLNEGGAATTLNIDNTVNGSVALGANSGVVVNNFGATNQDVLDVDAHDVQFTPDGSGGVLVQTDDPSPGTWHTIADLTANAHIAVATQADANALLASLTASGQFTHH